MDTRSLSIALIGNISDNNYRPSALLYYENPLGKVSALLQDGDNCVDITSQQSKSLPNRFHNSPHAENSKTLYESDLFNYTFSTPFSVWPESSSGSVLAVNAVFYTPNIPQPGGEPFLSNTYSFAGNFSGFSASIKSVHPE